MVQVFYTFCCHRNHFLHTLAQVAQKSLATAIATRLIFVLNYSAVNGNNAIARARLIASVNLR